MTPELGRSSVRSGALALKIADTSAVSTDS